MTRPNILMVQSDQHRFDCLSVNGHPLLRTPNLKWLASQGMNFTHAFCPIPLCVPVRNSLLNGQWPTEHMCVANYDTEAPRPAREELPTFSRLLRDSGYWLGYVGKWHVHRTKTPPAFGFNEYVGEGKYNAYRRRRGLRPKPTKNRWFGELDPHISPEDSRLAWGADNAIRMLEARAKGDRPFFVRWDPSEPHLPNIVPEPYCSMYPPDKIEPWPSFPDPLEGKPYIQAQQRRTWKLDKWEWKDWAKIVSRYLGEISLLDAQIGRVLKALDRLGLADNTLVIYTTDHGDMCGAHGMIDKHFIMYDDVVRVPMIMRWPGRIPASRRCDAFVAHAVDLAGTFCEMAGVSVPETFRGRSLLPLMTGKTDDNGRKDIFSTYHGNQFGLYSQRMVRDRRWKYIWNATAEDELYDLKSDPGEIKNRATDPACKGELRRLRHRMVAWMEETNDRLVNAWTKPQLLEGLSV